MKNIFLFISLIFISLIGFNQATIDAGIDDTLCPPTCVNLTATVTGGGSATDYEVTTIPFAPDPNAGTSVNLWDDSQTGMLPIGFTFCFFGQSYTQFIICSNNWIGFSAGQTSTWVTNTIPSTNANRPKNCILGPWHDINPSSGGTIKYQTLGVAPFRRLVVTYSNVPMYSCTSLQFTSQIIIYETTNLIENHIQSKPLCPSWNGGNAVQGLHDITGTIAVVYPGRNNTQWTATNEAVSYAPVATIEWYDGATLVGTGPNITVCPTVTTTYVAKLVSSCGTGAPIDTDTVVVNAICCAPPTMDSTDVTCFGACDGIGTASGNGTPPFSYQWDAAAGNQTTPVATGLCPGTYICTVTDATGCIEIGQVTISEPPVLAGTNDAQTNASCFGLSDGTVTITGTGGAGALTYDIGGGPQSSGVFTNLGVGAYNVTILDTNSCQVSIPVLITEPTEVVGTLVSSTDVTCFGLADGDLTVSAVGGVPGYQYSIDNGAVFQSGTLFNGLPFGSYDIIIEDTDGCQDTINANITEPTVLSLNRTLVDETCFNDCDGSIAIVGSGGTTPYTFSIDNCATSQSSGFFPNLCGSSYDICLTDANGCQVNQNVNIQDGPVIPDATITPIGPFCFGDQSVTLTSVSPGGVWSGAGVSGSTFDPSISGPGTFTITNTFSGVCGDVDAIDVTVNPLPVVSFVADTLTGCEPLNVTFTNTGSSGVSCLWDLGSGTAFGCGDILYSYTSGGTYDVTLTITDGNGCINSSTINDYISVYDYPTANFAFGPQETTILNPEISFTNGSYGEVSWDWNFGGAGISSVENPTFVFPDTGSYPVQLIVTSPGGCTSSYTQNVIIADQFLIFTPNTFTPDANAYNDVFLPYFNAIDPYDYSLFIYNRWGEVMFESHDTEVGWDGTYGNQGLVEDGVYVWKIEVTDYRTGDAHTFYGHVTVLK